MFKLDIIINFFLVTLRTLYRDKAYTLINIIGLSLAVASSTILFIFVHSELSFDKHNKDYKNIYRIVVESTVNSETNHHALSSRTIGPLFFKEYPDIGEFVRFIPIPKSLVKYKEKELLWSDMYYADTNVFGVFNHKVVSGDLEKSLLDPHSIAVSERFSKAYFGNKNPIGKIVVNGKTEFKVGAVFENLPENSHLKYNVLVSIKLMKESGLDDSNPAISESVYLTSYTYFRVNPEFDAVNIREYLGNVYTLFQKKYGDGLGISYVLYPQNISDIHFGEPLNNDQPTGNIFYIYSLIAVIVFLAAVACINYAILAISRTMKRSKEIGMRKVVGAERSQLVVQFIVESVIFGVIALVLGLLFVELAGTFSTVTNLFGKEKFLGISADPIILYWVILVVMMTTIVSGLYPAIYLSSISPMAAISSTKLNFSKSLFRKILVLTQFVVSISVLGCTLVMQAQLDFVSNKPLGFDSENRVVINLMGLNAISNMGLIRNELIKNSNIVDVAETYRIPGQSVRPYLRSIENEEGVFEKKLLGEMIADRNYLELMNIDIQKGRNFSKDLLTEFNSSVLVNNALVKSMGWKNPLGKKIVNLAGKKASVVGVMNDFHFESLHEKVAPLVVSLPPEEKAARIYLAQQFYKSSWVVIHISDNNARETIEYIKEVILKFDPKHHFKYKYIDQIVSEQYQSERNMIKLTSIFSGICILISCVGLYGYTAYSSAQRTKEMAIRKVLGATTKQIYSLLSMNLIQTILVACLISSVIGYFIMDNALEDFSYRADINVWNFFYASISIALIALVTVGVQTFRSATTNPIESLHYE